jgi:hypothetical protein
LEVSVALDKLPNTRELTINQLTSWFTGAILEKQLKVTNRRLRALEAIRKQARHEQIDPLEYKISLVAYFIRYAKFKTQPMSKRALAYRLAWKLSEEVEASF